MHIVRLRKLGLPQDARDGFTLLEGAGLIDTDNAARMYAMVGFRNVAVHRYRDLRPSDPARDTGHATRRLHRVRQTGIGWLTGRPRQLAAPFGVCRSTMCGSAPRVLSMTGDQRKSPAGAGLFVLRIA